MTRGAELEVAPVHAEAIALAFLGLVFGSFYGVVASRVPEGRSVVTPPSACPACGHRLGVLDLIPVVSFLAQRARCRYCKAPIPWRYLWIEAASGAAFAAAHLVSGGHWPVTLTGIVFLSFLVILAFVDIERMLLPDRLTFPGIGAGLALAVAGVGYVPWTAALLGAVVGYAVMWLIRFASRGAMGGGDVKMLAMIGAFLGPADALWALFCASLIGTLFGGGMILARRHERGRPLPFGPFLALGALAALVISRPF